MPFANIGQHGQDCSNASPSESGGQGRVRPPSTLSASQPALFTTISIGPTCSVTCLTAARTDAVSVTSTGTAMAWPPASRICAAVDSATVRSRPVSTPISWNMLTRSSVTMFKGHNGIDHPHLQGLPRVVLPAPEPDLLGLLHPDEFGEQAGAVAAVERADLRSHLPEAGVVRRDGESADQVQDVATADGVAGDHRHDRHGQPTDLDL